MMPPLVWKKLKDPQNGERRQTTTTTPEVGVGRTASFGDEDKVEVEGGSQGGSGGDERVFVPGSCSIPGNF